nr:hypothetical protein [Halovivax sp.]
MCQFDVVRQLPNVVLQRCRVVDVVRKNDQQIDVRVNAPFLGASDAPEEKDPLDVVAEAFAAEFGQPRT